jgi:hypothetical protein
MNKPTLWRRILRGLKMYKSAILLTWGGIMIPAAMFLMVSSDKTSDDVIALAILIMGIVSMIGATLFALKDERRDNAKYLAQLGLTKESFDNLITEVQGLRRDLKENRNDSRNRPKQ